MCSFPFPARIRIIDKYFIQNRLYDITQSMMSYSIAERSSFDSSLLGISNDKLAVAAVFICFMRQFPTQRE